MDGPFGQNGQNQNNYVRTLVVIAVLLVTEGIEGDEDVWVVTKTS